MTEQTFNFHLSPLERQLLRKFKTLLWTEQKKTFTSDDFRQYGLDQHIEDKQHGIGGLFARAVHNKIIKRVGTKRSVLPKNNYRKIGEYEFVEDSS